MVIIAYIDPIDFTSRDVLGGSALIFGVILNIALVFGAAVI